MVVAAHRKHGDRLCKLKLCRRTYSSIDKIRAELAWVSETPDPNKCGCRNLRCCEETGHKPGECTEHCNPEGAEIPFDNNLDRVTGSDSGVTDYVLEHPAKCPNCRVRFSKRHLSSLRNNGKLTGESN